jgi:hypothetical protein
VVQAGVLERDRQAEARATGRAGASGVGAPEPGEDVGRLTRPQTDAVVLDDDRHGIRPDTDVDVDGPTLTVLDGVDDEVAQDALDPALVDLGLGRLVGQVEGDHAPPPVSQRPGGLDDAAQGAAQVDRLDVEGGGAGVEAADLEEVGEQFLEPVELTGEQLGGAGHRGVEAGAGVVDDVDGHPDRRERGAQFVRDVGDEALLHGGQPLELADLRLQAVGHGVERRREDGEVVLAARRHPFVELAGRQPLGDLAGAAHRGDDLPGDDPRDGADEQGQGEAGDGERVRDEVHRRDLLPQRVDEVEVVGAGVGHLDDAADDDRREVLAADGDLAHLGLLATRGCRDGRLELGAHLGDVEGSTAQRRKEMSLSLATERLMTTYRLGLDPGAVRMRLMMSNAARSSASTDVAVEASHVAWACAVRASASDWAVSTLSLSRPRAICW